MCVDVLFKDFISEINNHIFNFVETDRIFSKWLVRLAKQDDNSFDAGCNNDFYSVFIADVQVNIIINVKVMWCFNFYVRG